MRNEFFRRVFRLGYGYTFFILLMETVMLCMKCPPVSWLAMLVLFGLFVVFYVTRELTTRVWVLFLVALLCGVGIWFLPEIMLQKLLLLGIDIGLLVTGIGYLSRGGSFSEPLDIPWPIILLAVVSTGAGLYYDISLLVVLSVVMMILNILFFLLIRYTDSVGHYQDSVREVKGLPLRKMLRINTWIVVGIFLLMGIGILLGELLGIPSAVSSFLDAGKEMLKGLFYGLVLLVNWFVTLFGGSSKESLAESEAEWLAQSQKAGSGAAEIIFTILRILLLIGLLYLALRLLIFFMKLLLVKFQRSGKEEIIENSRQDVKEFLPDRGLMKRFRQYITPEEKARRIYRKRILAAAGENLPTPMDTTGDICGRIELPELTRLYEAVRYGNVVVDGAYLRRMKKADTGEKP